VYSSTPEAFSLKSFSDSTQIEILSLNEEEIVFDLKGVEPPMANALRRILISEIPTMAIEVVNIYQNTSVIPDEVLSHRIGLIPIFADANEFQYKKEHEEFNEHNAIYCKLHIKCELNKSTGEVQNNEVLSCHIQWTPIGQQAKRFVGSETIRTVHEDILVAKLRPGQEIEAELICVKGIGKTHAKWSPVSTAFYRLMPDIQLKSEINDEEAHSLKKLCPTGVFDVEENQMGTRAVVKNPRNCTTCRECIRYPPYKDIVDLGKAKDHFECNFKFFIINFKKFSSY
jgi:DNA-directed RNA polymerase I and III subunit RPAC1